LSPLCALSLGVKNCEAFNQIWLVGIGREVVFSSSSEMIGFDCSRSLKTASDK
jgi:hypothetical protein